MKTENGKISLGSSNDKVLYGSVVENDKFDEIKFKVNGKIAWTTKK